MSGLPESSYGLVGSMTSTYRALIPYDQLLKDLWGILQEKREPVYPRGSRAAPSSVVYVFPNFSPKAGYFWEFWENVAAPTLIALSANPPPYVGGWNNPISRDLVDSALRASLASSAWANQVDFVT